MNEFLSFMQKNWSWMAGCAGLITGVVIYVYTRLKALQLGVQALLRAQMITYYNHYRAIGSVPHYARDSFENCWVQYERMGKNGVMKDIHDRFMQIPLSEEV